MKGFGYIAFCLIILASCNSLKDIPVLSREEGNFFMSKEFTNFTELRNRFYFFISGVDCETIVIKTNNGDITKNGCYYTIVPTDTILTYLYVYVKYKNKLVNVFNTHLNVRNYLEPEIILSTDKFLIKECDLFEMMYLPHYTFHPFFRVHRDGLFKFIKFDCIMYKDGISLDTVHHESMYFKDEYFYNLSSMSKNDSIIIDNISFEFANGTKFKYGTKWPYTKSLKIVID